MKHLLLALKVKVPLTPLLSAPHLYARQIPFTSTLDETLVLLILLLPLLHPEKENHSDNSLLPSLFYTKPLFKDLQQNLRDRFSLLAIFSISNVRLSSNLIVVTFINHPRNYGFQTLISLTLSKSASVVTIFGIFKEKIMLRCVAFLGRR